MDEVWVRLGEYAREVASFRLGPEPEVPAPAENAQRLAARVLAAFARSGRRVLVLLGLGSGTVATEVLRGLPEDARLLTLELAPGLARQLAASGRLPQEEPRFLVLADASPWALALLVLEAGLGETAFVLANPELPPAAKAAWKPLEALLRGSQPLVVAGGDGPILPSGEAAQPGASPCAARVATGFAATATPCHQLGRDDDTHGCSVQDAAAANGFSRGGPTPANGQAASGNGGRNAVPVPTIPALAIGAILRPDEPGLNEFFARIPGWVREVVCVWDAQRVPERLPRLAAGPRRVDLAHPLGGDFAAQRNRMLGAATARWMLYLDADERLEPWIWAALPELIAGLEAAGFAAALFPRLTLWPDDGHVKIGYGLWPDLQLRLFRTAPGLAFERPVHERLRGLPGPAVVCLNASLLHLNRLAKDDAMVRAKLETFDAAARKSGGGLAHVLSAEYPCLPLERLPGGRPSLPWRLLPVPPALMP